MNNEAHNAWRFLNNGTIAYVEWINNGKVKGDRYSYTGDIERAKQMTEKQCKDFCAYMHSCGTVGFWN